MPVSGLVIVFDDAASDASERRTAAMQQVSRDRRLTIGDVEIPVRVPVVLETGTHRESRSMLTWLEQLPGVALVEIAHVDWSEDSEP